MNTTLEPRDLDLLVDRLPGTGMMKLARLQMEAEALLGLPVDVHTPDGLREQVRLTVMKTVLRWVQGQHLTGGKLSAGDPVKTRSTP